MGRRHLAATTRGRSIVRYRVRRLDATGRRHWGFVAWLIGWSVAIGAAGAQAADASHPVVVELFQSQGCSSCPPANANVNALSQRADALALSLSVTYWDSLGWKDTFAKGRFTDRAATGQAVVMSGGSVEIGATSASAQAADVWLVCYDQRTLEAPVLRGEDAGKTLPHRNIVREMVRLGGWDGQAKHFSLPADDSGLGMAVLLQTHGAGPILAAAEG
jgi:hypothetical protein